MPKPPGYKPFNGDDARKVFWETTLERQHCPCGAPAEMVFTSSMLISDLPAGVRQATKIMIGGKRIKPFLTPSGYAVITGKIYACSMHRKDAEIVAARSHSYARIDRDYGPGAPRVSVQVAGSLVIAPG